MKLLTFLILSQLAACSSGCAGYMTAAELERGKQGPVACETRCGELGMRMGALALIDEQHAGCVCVPKSEGAVASTQGSEQAAVIAGAGAIIADEEQEQQAQQQHHQTPPAR